MPYVVKLFDETQGSSAKALERYLNNANISPDQIVSITLGVDSDAEERWLSRDLYKVLLVHTVD